VGLGSEEPSVHQKRRIVGVRPASAKSSRAAGGATLSRGCCNPRNGPLLASWIGPDGLRFLFKHQARRPELVSESAERARSAAGRRRSWGDTGEASATAPHRETLRLHTAAFGVWDSRDVVVGLGSRVGSMSRWMEYVGHRQPEGWQLVYWVGSSGRDDPSYP
jgi:hypothetical protein